MLALVLRLHAPLMSFGNVAVDNRRPTAEFPPLSAVAGLIGGALGYQRSQTHLLQRLQDRLRLASRIDRSGELITDFQTVDLNQPWMDGSKRGVGWTTQDEVHERRGQNIRGTHIRYRQYWADRIATVAIGLEPENDPPPSLSGVAEALRSPCRPLYLGRKGCPPSEPLLLWSLETHNLLSALSLTPPPERSDSGPFLTQWPDEEYSSGEKAVVWDMRDWANQIHAGSRVVRIGRTTPSREGHHV